MQRFLTNAMRFPSWWLKRNIFAWLLWPFSKIFLLVVSLRRWYYQQQWLKSYRSSLPVIVVGNITVGGTGKTPIVIAIAQWLQQQGLRPGIISRGYKSQAPQYPFWVTASSSAQEAGDEPLLIAQRTGCPVVIDAIRTRAVKSLENFQLCDVIISDDGLQHYALARDIEIIVIDGERRFGNGFLLPAGMLREPISRCKQADFVICNGGRAHDNEYAMQLNATQVYALNDPLQKFSLTDFRYKKVHAVAGIGNPERFFNLLRQMEIDVIPHVFPDHYNYTMQDFNFTQDNLPILMTEKDAVKCGFLSYPQTWCVAITAELPENFFSQFNVAFIKARSQS